MEMECFYCQCKFIPVQKYRISTWKILHYRQQLTYTAMGNINIRKLFCTQSGSKQIFRIKFTCSMFIYLQKQWMRTFRKNGNVNRLLKDYSDDTSFSGWIPLSRVVVSNLPFARATFVFLNLPRFNFLLFRTPLV